MEMRRVIALLLAAWALAASAPAPAVPAAAPGAAPEAPAAPAMDTASVAAREAKEDKAEETVLALRAEGEKFREAMNGLVAELGGEIAVEEMMLGPGTGAAEVASAVRSQRARAVVLMDNEAIRLYAAVQKAWKEPAPPPPAVALMAVRVDKAVAGMRRVTGIFYEVPGVTILVNLRSLLKDPVRKVGVIHRGAMSDFVRESARWCAAENIVLVPYVLPDKASDVSRSVRAGVRRLWRKDEVDALWVLNDNFYLTPEIIREGWLPALERFEKPVLVGVENFVSKGIKFGTYAVLPDHYGLGVQAAGLLMRLQEDGWEADEAPALRQPLAITKLLNLGLARKYSRIHEDRLLEIDKVVK